MQSGVRQGSSLSPSIFNVFINVYLTSLKSDNTGCCIGGNFVGVIMYADDLILLSATVSGLQSMLNSCTNISRDCLMEFNHKKVYVVLLDLRPSLV